MQLQCVLWRSKWDMLNFFSFCNIFLVNKFLANSSVTLERFLFYCEFKWILSYFQCVQWVVKKVFCYLLFLKSNQKWIKSILAGQNITKLKLNLQKNLQEKGREVSCLCKQWHANVFIARGKGETVVLNPSHTLLFLTGDFNEQEPLSLWVCPSQSVAINHLKWTVLTGSW